MTGVGRMTGCQERAGRPNVLLLLTDDQGAWAMPSRMPELVAPTLARLEREGTTLAGMHCASPVCSPARASLLTGRMPSAHGVHDWLRPEALARAEHPAAPHDPDFPARAVGADAIAPMLSRHGYRCGLVGKWHVGSSHEPAPGYDHWWAHQLGGGRYHGAPVWRHDPGTGRPVVPAEGATEPRHLTEAITREALRFLRGPAADPTEPFFLQVAWTAPHDPWFDGNHPDELLDLYARTDFPSVPAPPRHPWARRDAFARARADRHGALAGYCAALSGVDRSIAALLAQLEEDGRLEDTIVVFTSDNGFACGHHGVWGKGNGTRPLNLWQPSVTVPCVVRWPGQVPAGRRVDRPVSATSLLETLGELTGARPLPDPLRAGRSLAPLLRGEEPTDDAPCGGAPGEEEIAVHDEYGGARMLRSGRWKLVRRHDGPTELYDLEADPGEEHDLSEDPAQDGLLARLTARLEAWFAEHSTPALDGWEQDVDGDGQIQPLG